MLQLIDTFQFDQVIKLCQSGIHPDSHQDCYHVTPLIHACWKLLSHNKNGKNIESDWLNLIETLLKYGSNPNHYGQNRGTALNVTICHATTYLSGSFGAKIIKLLLDHGAAVNLYPYTLSYAVHGTHPHPEIVKLLLQHGVCQTNRNERNYTPLDLIRAKKTGCYANAPNLIAIQYMLEHGWQQYDLQEEQRKKQLLQEEQKRQEEINRQHRQEAERKKQQLLQEEINRQEAERKKQQLLQEEINRQEAERKKQQLLQEEINRQHMLQEAERKKQQEEITRQQLLQDEIQKIEEEQNKLLKQQQEIIQQEKYDLMIRINYMMQQIHLLSSTVKNLQNKCDEYEKNNNK